MCDDRGPHLSQQRFLKMAKPVSKVEQSLFEEDDEFEEFPIEGN